MKHLLQKSRRLSFSLVAALTAVSVLVPALLPSAASAGQVTTRSINMSSSTPGGSVQGQNVSYAFTFTAISSAQSLVVDFCNSATGPIIGTTCTAPTGMTAASATLSTGTQTTNWSLTASASQIKLTKSTGSAIAAGAVTFTINNVTNPTTTGTFYARLVTYQSPIYDNDNNAGTTTDNYSSASSVGTYNDYGGFALSTANLLTVNATVQEQLTFCVSKAAPGSGCSGTNTPALTLGSGSPVVLGTGAASGQTDTAYTAVTTNANSGTDVYMTAFKAAGAGVVAACAGLSNDGGTTCPIAGNGSFAAIANGAGKVGLLVANSGACPGAGFVCANSNYGTTAATYGMRTQVATSAGDIIESATAPCTDQNNLLTFAANAAATTPAGVYSANYSLTAVGKF